MRPETDGLASCQQSDGTREQVHSDRTQIEARPSRFPWLPGVARWTKINSSDPPLPAVGTTYPAPPFLPGLSPTNQADLLATM
jgi:hypothetical protein